MTKQDAYGESTIAISVYNLACLVGRPVDFDELFSLLTTDFNYNELTEDLLQRSIDGLLKRKLILKRGELLYSIDTKRRRIVGRNRDDAFVDDQTGVVLGGWEGWVLSDPKRGRISIDEVIG